MPTTMDRPTTEKQLAFARSLYREIQDAGAPSTQLEALAESGRINRDSGRTAFSAYIDALIIVRDEIRAEHGPQRGARDATSHATNVPAGRYAVEGADNVLHFIQVDRPDEGRWAGYVFVNELHGSPGDLRRTPVRDRGRRDAYLARIGEDPQAASRLFGQEIGTCGVCGSPLTNEESRAYGIGPVCRENTGW